MRIIHEYWQFVSRPSPSALTAYPSGMDLMPHFYRDVLYWTFVFCALFVFVPIVTYKLFPNWYKQLDKRKKNDYPSYIVCLFHHFVVVPLGFKYIYEDFILSSAAASMVNYSLKEALIAPFCLGYLFGDTIFYAMKEAIRGRFEYIIHHILTLYLVFSTIIGPGQINRFIPHLLICDSTNIFFNIAWIMRLTPLNGSIIVTTFELIFTLLFVLTRVINMSSVFFMMHFHPEVDGLGYAKYTLFPIALLQWYWCSKILRTMFIRLFPKREKSN